MTRRVSTSSIRLLGGTLAGRLGHCPGVAGLGVVDDEQVFASGYSHGGKYGLLGSAMAVTLEDIRAARERLGDAVVRTPLAKSETLSAKLGADIHLKFENQQFTASFKERGALNRLLLLAEDTRARGVVAMSAGNHAQALAYHGRRLDVPVTIVMPRSTPNAKVQQTRVFGAEVLLHGNRFAETYEFTQALAEERDFTLIHPFDDEAVIAGQGTLGLEMLEQVPDLDTVIVPVGGGGLIAGIANRGEGSTPGDFA